MQYRKACGQGLKACLGRSHASAHRQTLGSTGGVQQCDSALGSGHLRHMQSRDIRSVPSRLFGLQECKYPRRPARGRILLSPSDTIWPCRGLAFRKRDTKPLFYQCLHSIELAGLRLHALSWLTVLGWYGQVRAGLLTLVGGVEGEGELGQCTMCEDIPEDPVVSACGHPYCRQCISAQVCC